MHSCHLVNETLEEIYCGVLQIAEEYVEDGEETYRLRIDAAIAAADGVASTEGEQQPPTVMIPSMLLAAYQMTQ